LLNRSAFHHTKQKNSKRKFDQACRNYDSATQKLHSALKDKGKNKDERVKEMEQEREKQKEQYMARGEEAYTQLLETNEMNEFRQLENVQLKHTHTRKEEETRTPLFLFDASFFFFCSWLRLMQWIFFFSC